MDHFANIRFQDFKTVRELLGYKNHEHVKTNKPGEPSMISFYMLTLFMSSDRTSLGWAVLESRVTSTVSKEDEKSPMLNYLIFDNVLNLTLRL